MPIEPGAGLIFAATIAVSLYALYARNDLIDRLILRPWSFFRDRKWFTVISSGFLHADLFHLTFNMLTFYFFAFELEAAMGTRDFLILYFASMVLADVTSILKHKDDYAYASLGASGAVSGVVFASILYNPGMSLGVVLFPIPIPAPIFALLYLAFCHFAGRKQYDNVNHEAHFWGALSGVVVTAALQPSVITNFFNQLSFL